jgi:DNA-binding NarL/FixJ family response regulator
MVRIMLADDHELVRRGLIRILSAGHPDWEVVAEAATGFEAIQTGILVQPDLAIIDLSLPDCTGLDVAKSLIENVPGIRTLVLTMHAAAPILAMLRKAGVNAYLAKHEAPRTLAEAVERVLAGEPFFASADAYRAAAELQPSEYVPAQFLLTTRELSVMKLLAQGRSNKQLAGDLDMSVRTAETHHASILHKLDVNSLADLVRIAVRDELI